MDLILKPSGGQNVVLRPAARAPWYEEATVDAAEVEMFKQHINPETGAFVGAPTPLGRFPAVGPVIIEHNPQTDRDVIIYAMPYSAEGAAGYSDLRHATQVYVPFQRETTAPEIGQMGDATTEDVTVGVSGYSTFARLRRVRIASALDGSGHLVSPAETVFDSTPDAPPPYVDITRGAGPQTIYVAVAHSSGAGRWTPDSNVLTVTFASADGTGGGGAPGSGEPTGGTEGDFDPVPRHQIEL
jgi:hypothetical protein